MESRSDKGRPLCPREDEGCCEARGDCWAWNVEKINKDIETIKKRSLISNFIRQKIQQT